MDGKDIDAAAAERDAAAEEIRSSAMGRQILRKIDFRIIPLLFVTYNFNFMDKTILSSASVFGLEDSTVGYVKQLFHQFQNTHRCTESFRIRLQLGLIGLLLWISLLGIPDIDLDPTTAGWQVRSDQHILLGRRCSRNSGMYQLRGPYHCALSPWSSRSNDIARILVHHLDVVYAQ